MANQDEGTAILEEVQIIWRNFAGEKGPYNASGAREFSVPLSPEMAASLSAQGWNVKTREPREEGDDPLIYLTVTVGYKVKPPQVIMVTSRGRVPLSEDTIAVLDYANIEKADLIIRPYNWDVNGKQGVKAYLKTLFVIIEEDYLERKYGLTDVASSAIEGNEG